MHWSKIGLAADLTATNMLKIMGAGYLGKVLYEVAMTPVTYRVVAFLKRVEKVDVYDRATNFSPFGHGMEGLELVPLVATG